MDTILKIVILFSLGFSGGIQINSITALLLIMSKLYESKISSQEIRSKE